jgi:hypothetical protein
MKRSVTMALLASLLSFSAMAQKASVFNTKGIAINGYDVVAFFTDSNAVKGMPAFKVHWQDADWLFINTEHAASFKANPEKYAPQYGGYCAYGTAEGHKAPTEIDTWKIKDGKLYFNYNKQVQKMWLNDLPHLIEKADGQWPLIKDKE